MYAGVLLVTLTLEFKVADDAEHSRADCLGSASVQVLLGQRPPLFGHAKVLVPTVTADQLPLCNGRPLQARRMLSTSGRDDGDHLRTPWFVVRLNCIGNLQESRASDCQCSAMN